MSARSLTHKQERFAEAYVETGSLTEAYKRAYDTSGMAAQTVRVAASKEAAKPHVRSYIEGLREIARERSRVTVEMLTAELDEARKLAMVEAQPAAAISATMGKAKLHRLLEDTARLDGHLIITWGDNDGRND
ncbi:MAG: terminase [Alphaproteobacteria bacterium]|nr:MAG: terminase [Alphaproteobacteria bacterium]